jgi:hypothetical protein
VTPHADRASAGRKILAASRKTFERGTAQASFRSGLFSV